MLYQTQDRAGSRITIAKLILQESGSYNPMFSRPYQTHVTNETLGNIVSRIDSMKGGKVTGSLLAGVASNMLNPSATHNGEIPIPMGWADRRIRFILETHVRTSTGSDLIYYFQGYTTHLGVTHGGSIDPNMEFVLNSYIRVNRAVIQTAYGPQVTDTVTESAHIVNGSIVNQMNGQVYGMRPQDIFTGIQSSYLENSYRAMSPQDSLQDYRIQLSGESVMSKRSNGLAGSFVAKVVDSYQTGKELIDFGQGNDDIYARSQNLAFETTPFENQFIRALSNVRGVHCATTFRFPDLLAIDNNAEAVTDYITLGNTQNQQLHQAGQTSYWNGADRETLAATILSNAVPAVMMDLMLSKVYFRATNHSMGGVVVVTLIDGKSITTANLSQHFELFKRRLEHEVLFDMTHGNQVLFNLEMQADLFGETRITISLDNGPAVPFTTPSFCDSLLTPVMTGNKDNFFGVVHDFEILMNSLPQAKGPVFNSFV